MAFVKLFDFVQCHTSEPCISESFYLLFCQIVHFPLQNTNDLDSVGNSFRHKSVRLEMFIGLGVVRKATTEIYR